MHSHAPLSSAAGLDWTVQAQIIKLGGLKHQSAITPDQVDARVDALRQQAKAAQAQKQAAGGKTAPKAGGEPGGDTVDPGSTASAGTSGGGGGAGVHKDRPPEAANTPPPRASGAVPDEYQWFETEEREELLGALRHGPDKTWLDNAHTVSEEGPPVETLALTPQEQDKYRAMQALEAQGTFNCLEGASNVLGTLVRSLVLDCQLAGQPREVCDALVGDSSINATGSAEHEQEVDRDGAAELPEGPVGDVHLPVGNEGGEASDS